MDKWPKAAKEAFIYILDNPNDRTTRLIPYLNNFLKSDVLRLILKKIDTYFIQEINAPDAVNFRAAVGVDEQNIHQRFWQTFFISIAYAACEHHPDNEKRATEHSAAYITHLNKAIKQSDELASTLKHMQRYLNDSLSPEYFSDQEIAIKDLVEKLNYDLALEKRLMGERKTKITGLLAALIYECNWYSDMRYSWHFPYRFIKKSRLSGKDLATLINAAWGYTHDIEPNTVNKERNKILSQYRVQFRCKP